MSVMENITLASLSQMSRLGFKVRKKQIELPKGTGMTFQSEPQASASLSNT